MAKSLLEAKEVASPMSDVDTYIRFFREKEMAKALLSKRDLNAAQKKKESAIIETNFKKTVENLEHVRAEAHQIMSERRESEDETKGREPRQAGGSMLNPPEREEYQLGSLAGKLAKALSKEIKVLQKKLTKKHPDKNVISFTTKELKDRRKQIGDDDAYEDYLSEFSIVREQDESIAKIAKDKDISFSDAEAEYLGREVRKPRQAGELEPDDIDIDQDKWGGLDPSEAAYEYSIEGMSEKQIQEMEEVGEELEIILPPPGWMPGGREPRQAGGSIMVPPEMEATEAPVDTYPNIPPEEMAEVEASQLPDQEMEDNYVDFVMNEALDPEEQTYLMNALEADPQLSMIFDKVVDTASEFSGAGEVNGPGDGVSDSIPARLSDGEFVVTKKATDQIGADNLQTMMDEAERAFDGGLMEKDRGIEDEEIKKSMVASNQMPSLNVRQR